ncbi:MAG: hypothetical protein ACJ76Y_22525 [Thermoanaerobaculia bacterium]
MWTELCYKETVQDRYAADIGDFGKLALVRALALGQRLGICWYMTNGFGEFNNDGRYLAYLQRPARFRQLDPECFDALASFVADFEAGRCPRSIESLEALALLPSDSLFHNELCPGLPAARRDWVARMVKSMDRADLIFLDPDNGLEGATLSPKSTAIAELVALRRSGRALLLYHHQSRRAGGAVAEAAHVARRLAEVGFAKIDAVRLRPYSSRFYFLLDAETTLRGRLQEFAAQWGNLAQIYPTGT